MDRPAPDVVVVTGTGGMGLAIARRLAAGCQLVLADNRPEQLHAAVTQLAADGHAVTGVPTDIAEPGDVAALVHTVRERGRLRCLAHTAGVSPVQASAERIIAVDVVGTAHLLDAFEAAVQPGSVGVFIASMAGTMMTLAPELEDRLAATPTAELAGLAELEPAALDPGIAYAVAKRANQLRIQAASLSWGSRGGRVVSVSPGVISTPMGRDELAGPSGDFMRLMVDQSGTGRLGTPDDIAAVVEFLASPAASFITGTDILVDGGAVAAVRRSPAFRPAAT